MILGRRIGEGRVAERWVPRRRSSYNGGAVGGGGVGMTEVRRAVRMSFPVCRDVSKALLVAAFSDEVF